MRPCIPCRMGAQRRQGMPRALTLAVLLALGFATCISGASARPDASRFVDDLVQNNSWVWLAIALPFTIYVLDGVFYLTVAFIARLHENLRPQPGHPRYRRSSSSSPASPAHSAKSPAGKGGKGGSGASRRTTPNPDYVTHALNHAQAGSTGGSSPAGPHGTSPAGAVLMDLGRYSSSCSEGEGHHASGASASGPRRNHLHHHHHHTGASTSTMTLSSTNNSDMGSGDHAARMAAEGPLQAHPLMAPQPTDPTMYKHSSMSTSDAILAHPPSQPPSGSPYETSSTTSQHSDDPIMTLPVSKPASHKAKVSAAAAAAAYVPPPQVKPELVECYAEGYPMVAIQLPMYNEGEHCERVVRDTCRVAWPRSRLLIQINDDSTKEDVKQRVDAVAQEMVEQGHLVQVTRRPNRVGFKAGAMVAGLEQLPPDLPDPVKYVAIFDADFAPPVDFLFQTIYHMEHDAQLGFVQTRWAHANVACVLTWMQKVCLDFHFAVEQRARGFLRTFYGFNGTAGVWRLEAIEGSGGWHTDTTVEDMDLSIRAFAAGWRFKYLHHVSCWSELPSTMQAYKSQQYRWQSGPMQVLKKSVVHAWGSDRIGFFQKISASWFFIRYAVNATVVVVSACVPPILLFCSYWAPWRWGWPQIFFIASSNAYTLTYLLFAPLGWWLYALLATATGYFRIYCVMSGLLGAEKSKGWKVTAKVGASVTVTQAAAAPTDGSAAPADGAHAIAMPPEAQRQPKKKKSKSGKHKPYMLELGCCAYFLGMLGVSIWLRQWVMIAYCFIMAATFLALSCWDWLPSLPWLMGKWDLRVPQ